MADMRDLMAAISDTNDALRKAEHEPVEHGLIHSNLAIACAIREAGIRLEIQIREAAGRG